MPWLFWLALLLGYLTGVTAAVLWLPAPLIEPVHGPLALTTVVVIAALGGLLRLGWGRMGDVARPAVQRQPARGGRLLPLPAAAAYAAGGQCPPETRAGDERWPVVAHFEAPGVLGPSELRRILHDGQVDLRLRPVASPTQPDATWYYALPGLRAAGGQQLEPASYRTTAARAGLLGAIDRLLLLRCVDMVRAANAARTVTVLCGIAAVSLNDPGFIAELEEQLSEDPALAASLVLTLDHTLRDRPSVAAARGLRARGLRFGLRRLGLPQLEPATLRAAGFAFVLLEAERFALAPEDAPDRALLELQHALGQDGLQLLVSRAAADGIALADRVAQAADGPPLALAQPSAA